VGSLIWERQKEKKKGEVSFCRGGRGERALLWVRGDPWQLGDLTARRKRGGRDGLWLGKHSRGAGRCRCLFGAGWSLASQQRKGKKVFDFGDPSYGIKLIIRLSIKRRDR